MEPTTRKMYVVKRDGKREAVEFDKVVRRINALSGDLSVCPEVVAQRVLTEI